MGLTQEDCNLEVNLGCIQKQSLSLTKKEGRAEWKKGKKKNKKKNKTKMLWALSNMVGMVTTDRAPTQESPSA